MTIFHAPARWYPLGGRRQEEAEGARCLLRSVRRRIVTHTRGRRRLASFGASLPSTALPPLILKPCRCCQQSSILFHHRHLHLLLPPPVHSPAPLLPTSFPTLLALLCDQLRLQLLTTCRPLCSTDIRHHHKRSSTSLLARYSERRLFHLSHLASLATRPSLTGPAPLAPSTESLL